MQYQRLFVEGNLVADPVYTVGMAGEKQARCTFRVLVTERWGDRDDQRHTEAFNVVVFGNQADTCGRYLERGQEVLVEGRNRTRPYVNSAKETRYYTELVADRVQFGRKSQNGGHTPPDSTSETSIPE